MKAYGHNSFNLSDIIMDKDFLHDFIKERGSQHHWTGLITQHVRNKANIYSGHNCTRDSSGTWGAMPE